MRRSLPATLLGMLLLAPPLEAQILDHTMVPKGRLRLQASPVFESWDTRFGRDAQGAVEEKLGDDLTEPATVALFPGVASLASAVEAVTATSFDPVLGSTAGLVRRDVTRIEFGGHLGVTDWLTLGVVFPWTRTRAVIDVAFTPDTANATLGLNPSITEPGSVDSFLGSLSAAEASAASFAASECSAGPSPSCTAAQDLAARTAAFEAALATAYGASPFFPLSGTTAGDALSQSASQLSADLTAAGLSALLPMVLSTDLLAEEGDLATLPALAGAGFDSGVLGTRQSLWSAGDVEASARMRLLDNLTPTGPEWTAPRLGYRLSGRFLVRLPTGTPPDPDLPLDLGTGDAQTDLEAGLTGSVRFGSRFGITAGGYYGVQGETTRTVRVVPPEQLFAPVATRTEVTWRPGAYMGAAVAPTLRLAPSIMLAAEYRFFHKARDEFELADVSSPLNPAVLAIESGVKAHVIGGGLRYDTVDAWRRGDASLPIEVHLRLLATVAGSGGQVPKATRVEAGLRLFRRFWGSE
ncbi:MAG: hypothetical protein R3253_09795 [Longimicrobiales bacterium]|nr:hypothetical protein [Longimicrobiales bacterium]